MATLPRDPQAIPCSPPRNRCPPVAGRSPSVPPHLCVNESRSRSHPGSQKPLTIFPAFTFPELRDLGFPERHKLQTTDRQTR
jgi:hypothetical protein